MGLERLPDERGHVRGVPALDVVPGHERDRFNRP
jgi:hypothetical protein